MRTWSSLLLLVCALPPRALAHGGAYNPGGGVPTGPFAPGGPGPATGMPSPGATAGPSTSAIGNRSSWEDWWHFNKDPYLELKRAVSSGFPVTTADELLSGVHQETPISPEILRSRVAPALRALLEAEHSPEIVGAALVALARVCGPGGAASGFANALAGSVPGSPGSGASGPGASGPALGRAESRAGGSTASAVEAATVALFETKLRDGNQEIAETAALALGILRSEESLPILEALLSESVHGKELVGGRAVSDRTRAFAAYGLGLIGTSAKNNRARQMVARALSASLPRSESSTERMAPIADVEVAAVIALSIDHVDPERSTSPAPSAMPAAPSAVIPSVTSSTAWISRQTELRFLRGIFEDARRAPVIRAHAATAIARLGSDAPGDLRAEAEEELLEALRARSKLENAPLQSCAQALGLLGTAGNDGTDRKIRLALVQVLEDADVQARCFALMALAEVGGRMRAGDEDGEGPAAYRNLITGQLLRGRGMARPWAAIALGVLERKLADARSAPKPKQSIAGPWESGSQGGEGQVSNAEIEASDRSRGILRSYFASAKQRTHIGAGAIAIGLCRDRKAVPMLLERLGDASEDQGQGYVALALGMIGDEQAIGALKEVVKASKYKPEALEQSSIALALLGDKSTALELADMLAKAQGQAAQASIATALGRIGDVRTIEPLLKLIERKDLTASARAFAAAALGQVADTDPMPWYTPIALDLNYVATTGTLLAGDGTGLLEIL